MFNLEYHQKIAAILSCLDANFLQECQAYFGGGTLLSLKYDEYRLSKDIDRRTRLFELVSDRLFK